MSTKSKKTKHLDDATKKEINDGSFIPSKIGRALRAKETIYTGAYLARCNGGGYRVINKDEIDKKTDMAAILNEHNECMNEIEIGGCMRDLEWQKHKFLIKTGDDIEVIDGITQEILFKADIIFDINDVRVLKNRFGKISNR